jgi:hypothetical protein
LSFLQPSCVVGVLNHVCVTSVVVVVVVVVGGGGGVFLLLLGRLCIDFIILGC